MCFIWTQLVVEHLVEMLAASRRIWSKRAMKHNEKYVDLAKSFTELHPSVFLGWAFSSWLRIRDWFYCHPISREVNDRPDSKRVAMAEAERLDFQTFQKLPKNGNNFQWFPMQYMQCFTDLYSSNILSVILHHPHLSLGFFARWEFLWAIPPQLSLRKGCHWKQPSA